MFRSVPSAFSGSFRSPFRAFASPVHATLRLPQKHGAQFRTYQQRFGRQRTSYNRFATASGRWEFASRAFMRWVSSPTFYRDVGVISVGAGGVYLYNLEEVPISGRRRFNLITPSIEAQMGASVVAEIRQQYGDRMLPDYDPRVRQLKRVLERMKPYAAAAGLDNVDWEVHIIDSPEVNAFVAPGGKVFFYTGILPICQDEDGIAAVLGHEIGHVVAHHTAETMTKAPIIILGLLILASFDISMGIGSTLMDVFLKWPASRKHESEADLIGLYLMSQACYRPEAAMELWTKMEKAAQANPPELLSTHPSPQNREEKIRGWLPRAYEQAEKSECHATAVYANQFRQLWQ